MEKGAVICVFKQTGAAWEGGDGVALNLFLYCENVHYGFCAYTGITVGNYQQVLVIRRVGQKSAGFPFQSNTTAADLTDDHAFSWGGVLVTSGNQLLRCLSSKQKKTRRLLDERGAALLLPDTSGWALCQSPPALWPAYRKRSHFPPRLRCVSVRGSQACSRPPSPPPPPPPSPLPAGGSAPDWLSAFVTHTERQPWLGADGFRLLH